MWEEAKCLNADILCIQETHFHDQKRLNVPTKTTPTITYLANASKKKQGVMVALKHSVSFTLHDTY